MRQGCVGTREGRRRREAAKEGTQAGAKRRRAPKKWGRREQRPRQTWEKIGQEHLLSETHENTNMAGTARPVARGEKGAREAKIRERGRPPARKGKGGIWEFAVRANAPQLVLAVRATIEGREGRVQLPRTTQTRARPLRHLLQATDQNGAPGRERRTSIEQCQHTRHERSKCSQDHLHCACWCWCLSARVLAGVVQSVSWLESGSAQQ